MKKTNTEGETLNIPKDIPDDFFHIVKKVLNFIEHVDQEKQK